MTKLEDSRAGSVSAARECRDHERRKLTGMAYVELTQDNGGILLNVGEGGLAVQCALALSSKDFPELRFQLPKMRGWLAGSGRVVWISESKKEAGIAFVALHEHTREQIRAWVAKETDTVAAMPEKQVAPDLRASLGEPARKPAAAQTHRPNSTGPAAMVPRSESAPDRVQPEAQNFAFTDYSMFGSDANAAPLWAQPAKPTVNWGRFALLIVLVAALFFVLGASVQHGDMGHLLAYVDAGKRVLQQPQGTAPGTVIQAHGENGSQPLNSDQPARIQGTTGNEQDTPVLQNGNDEENAQKDQTSVAQQDAKQSAEEQAAGQSSDAQQGNAPGESGRPETARSSESAGTAGVLKKGKEPSRNSSSSPVLPKTANVGTPGLAVNGHYILVNAPAPGTPSFFVNLPGEAVSASTTVAVTAQRSIEVPARAEVNADGPERVTIGRLLAHSDPFYPTEARSKRIEGSVELRAVVGRTGQVISVVPVRGPVLLITAATIALHEWRYEPTYINGDPVETHAEVTMVFRSP